MSILIVVDEAAKAGKAAFGKVMKGTKVPDLVIGDPKKPQRLIDFKFNCVGPDKKKRWGKMDAKQDKAYTKILNKNNSKGDKVKIVEILHPENCN